MLKEIHKILKDPDCAGNIKCFVYAFILVFCSLGVFLHAVALTQIVEPLHYEYSTYKGSIYNLNIRLEKLLNETRKNKLHSISHRHNYNHSRSFMWNKKEHGNIHEDEIY